MYSNLMWSVKVSDIKTLNTLIKPAHLDEAKF